MGLAARSEALKCIKKWTRASCVNKGGTAEGNFRPLNPSEDADSGRVFSRFYCLYGFLEINNNLPFCREEKDSKGR